MNSSLSFVLTLFLFAVQAVGAASNVSVLSSTESSVRFSLAFTSNLSQLTERRTLDSQTVLSRTITIVVPPTGTVSLDNAFGEDTAPVEFSGLNSSVSGIAPLVSLSSPFVIRGRRLVNAIICPLRGQSVYRRVTFGLAFGGPAEPSGLDPADPWFDAYLSKTAPNFSQAKNWKIEKSLAAASVVTTAPGPFSSGATFVGMTVRDNGIYRITGAMLQAAGVTLGNLSTDLIRVFSGGGLQNEFLNSRPRPQFGEIAVSIDDGGDARFDSGDQLLFFGEGLRRWTYAGSTEPKFVSHHFANDNFYWLAIGGNFAGTPLRMATVDGTVTGAYDYQATVGLRYIHVEQDSTLSVAIDGHLIDYYEWYWSSSPTLRLFVPTPGIMASTTSTLALSALTSFGSPNGYVTTRVNGVISPTSCNPGGCTGTTTALTTGLNQIDLTLSPLNPGTAPSYFNWIEFGYAGFLLPQGDMLDVILDYPGGRAQVVVDDQFASTPEILMLDNSVLPVRVIDYQRTVGKVTFETNLSAAAPGRLFMASPASFKSPAAMTLVAPIDLRADLTHADLVIVTIPQFVSALGEYVSYRAGAGRVTKIVTVNDIMDNFSWGVYDPTAIRDFLKYAYENWTAPALSAVLFVGDANFDYLNHLGSNEPNYVPSYNMPISFDPRGGDDNFVYFGNYGLLDSDTTFPDDRGFDMITARWPVKTASEIRAIIAKIKQYESGSNLASWRKNIVSVADDEYAGSDNTQGFHVTDAIALETGFFPRTLHLERLYLWDYPIVNGERPAVNDAIVNAINRGALVVNYVGHGNPDVWAHERVFRRTSDLSRLDNDGRLPLIFAASCDINHFDDPRREAMGEDFLSMSNRGAIGVVAAARLVYSFDNAALSKEVYRHLLGDTGLSISEALFAGKVARQYTGGTPFSRANDRAYLYFGDPFLKLGMAQMIIAFDQKPDSLVALGVETISGRVVDGFGTTQLFDGVLFVDVYDSDRPRSHEVAGTDQIVNYTLSGPSIYHGSATVTDGQFTFQFVTPLDVNFGGKGARVEIYAVLDSAIDAVGLVDSLAIRNSAAASTDSTGPAITYRVPGRTNFAGGDHVTRGEQLLITLADPSGINLTSGLGHGITIEVDDNSDQMQNLSSTFSFDQNSYTSGSTGFSFAGLEPGEHALKIKAWDNANNFAASSLTVDVVSSEALAIHNLLNYPNPMAGTTTFYFELTNPAQRFTLDIFTLSGRKIHSMERLNLSADNYPNEAVSIGWDGRDMVGDRVATGVYIYKATAMPQSGGQAVESFGKVVVVN